MTWCVVHGVVYDEDGFEEQDTGLMIKQMVSEFFNQKQANTRESGKELLLERKRV